MKNSIFKRISFIIITTFISVMFFSVKVNALDVKVKEAKVVETNMSITDPVIEDGVVTNDITFNNSGDYAIFEFTIINNDNEKYTIKDIVDNYKNKNLSIEYDYSKKEIHPNGTYAFRVKMTYKNTVKNIESASIKDLTISVNLIKEDGKESRIVIVNPKTGDSILKYLILLIIALTGFILKQKNKKAYKVLFILPILFLPFVIFANENYKLDIYYKNITLKGEMLPYEIKINVPDQEPIIKIVRYGDEIGELPEVDKEGYTFDGWEDKDGNKIDEHTKVTRPIEVNPKLTPIKYTITYDLNGGKATNPETYTIKDKITLKNPTKKGYNFSGWTGSNGDTLQTEVTISNLTGNLSFVAHYSKSDKTPYKVIHRKQTIDLTTYEVEDTDNLEGTTDSVVKPQPKTYTGFVSPEEQELTITPEGEATLTYDYNRVIYTYVVDENTISSIPSGEYPYETEVTITPKEIPGYTFDKWDDGNDDNPRTIKIDENTTDLKPIYKANTNTPYKVIHKIQNVDGVSYSEEVENLEGTTDSTVTPGIRKMEHFTKPELQTVRISGDGSTTVTYTYDREKYTFNLEDENVISSIPSGEYPYETKITVTPKDIPGYTFDEWNDGNKDNPRTIILDGDISIKPIYKTNTDTPYKVIHKYQNLDLTSYLEEVENLTGTTDTSVTPSIKSKTGFTSPSAQTITIKGDGTSVVEYLYTRNKYNYNLTDTENVISNIPNGEYPYETEITIEAKEKPGYDFEGWSDGNTDNPRTIKLESDITISPVYTSRTDTAYKVEHYYKKLNNDYEIEEVILTGETDSTVEAPLKPKTGFITPNVQTVKIKGDGSSKVKYYYERENYSFSITDRTYIDPSSTPDGNYPYETEITLKAKEKEGYTFKSWSNGDTNNPTTFKLSENIEITPLYDANKYTVIFNSNGGTGSMPNEEMTYDIEKAITSNAFTKTGYTFDSWNTASDGTGTKYSNEASVKNLATSGNTVLYAIWKANTNTAYKVVHRYQNLDLTTYTEEVENLTGTTDIEVTPSVKDKTGFISPNSKTDTIKPDGSLVITYTYARAKYIFNIVNSNDVISSKENGEYPYETEITLTAKEKTGYHFLNYNGDIEENPYTFKLTSNKEFTLNYEPNTYNIVFNSNGGTGTMSNLSMTYDVEKTLTKNAFNNTGYTFEKWNTASTGSGTSYNDEAKVKNLATSGNTNLYAIWSANELIFNGDDTISKVYSTSQEEVTITGASNGTGTYTYTEVSEKKDNVDSNYITIDNTTITLSGSIPAGIYTYVVQATDTKSGSSKEATYTITITKQKSDEVTNLNVTPEGIVSFTNSSNADGYLISIDGINYTPVMPGEETTSINYLSEITGGTGTRTIYVKAVNSDGDNYEVSDPVTKDVAVYTLNTSVNNTDYGTISKSSINVISGATYTTSDNTLTLSDTRTVTTSKKDITGYTTTFTGWSSVAGTISQNTSIIANYTREANEYTLTLNANTGTLYETAGWTGTGETISKTIRYDSEYSNLPTYITAYKSGYTLTEWNTKADGTGTSISNSDIYNLTDNQILYAVWMEGKAMFDIGKVVNAKMKKLAGNTSATYTSSNSNIYYFGRSSNRPDLSTFTEDNIVSVSNGEYNVPIYMWLENNTMYSWSDATDIYLNFDASYMYYGLEGLKTYDAYYPKYNSSLTTNMSHYLHGCTSLKNVNNLDHLDTSNVTDMSYMFTVVPADQIIFTDNDTSKVTDISYMFAGCSKMYTLYIQNLDLSNVENTDSFTGGTNIISIYARNTKFNDASIKIFANNSSLNYLYLDNADTTKVTNMEGIFKNCSNLQWVSGLNTLDTSNVTTMKEMFSGCSSIIFTYNDFKNFNTSKVTNMANMFSGCSSGGNKKIDLSSFDTSNVTDMSAMFVGCQNLETIYASDDFVTDNVTYSGNMFSGDTRLVGGSGTAYTSSIVDKTRALIDEGPSNPGYFTNHYTVVFNANDGTGIMDNQNIPLNRNALLNANTYTKPSSVFVGWNTASDGTGISYLDGASVNNLVSTRGETITLYAQWIEARAMFDTGSSVNAKMKKLAGNSSATYNSEDANITSIQKSTTKPDINSMTSDNIVSISNTTYNTPIYMWYDNGTIYWWSEDNNPSLNTDSSYMFNILKGLTNIDVTLFDTSNVTNMEGMFNNCSGLTSLDLGNKFYTSNVTNMQSMFHGCSSLTSLDLGDKFDTSNVTNMQGMFGGCSSLQSLDLDDKFDTSNVTYMANMFYECNSLTSLDLGDNFDTSRVTNMVQMFYGCNNLTSLDLGNNFDTRSVTSMRMMFSECSSLTSLDLGDKFDTSQVTDMSFMFSECSSLTSLDLGDKFDTSDVVKMYDMFFRCSSLTSLDLGDKFDTSNVTYMHDMFSECSSLTSLDLGSNFDTSKVTNMTNMFRYCSSLTSLDLGDKFDTSQVTNMTNMFYNDKNLETIFTSNNFVTTNVTTSTSMFYNCPKLVGGMGTKFSSSHTDAAYAHIDGGTSNPGYFTDKTNINIRFDANGGTGTMNNQVVQYNVATPLNTNTFTKSGFVFVGWNTKADGTGTAYADGANIQAKSATTLYAQWRETEATFMDGYSLNSKMRSLAGESTDKNSEVTKIKRIQRSNSLSITPTSDNVVSSSYTSSDVPIYMWYDNGTIYYYSEATNLYFDYSMYSMFWNFKSLNYLNISTISTSRVRKMKSVFYNCVNLTSLDITNWDTSNVTDMSGLFTNLKVSSLNISNFNTSKVTDMSDMFAGCSNLTSLNLNNFDTKNVTKMNSMFLFCQSLTSLNLSSFDTSNVTIMSEMFQNTKQLSTIDLRGFNTSKVTSMYAMFNTSGISSFNFNSLSGWDTSNVTNMQGMFGSMPNITSLDLRKFNTDSLTNSDSMFANMAKVTTIDLSSFNTNKLTSTNYMFCNCNVKTVYASNKFVTTGITSSTKMFYGATKIVGVGNTTYDSSHIDKTYARTTSPGYFTYKAAPTGGNISKFINAFKSKNLITNKFILLGEVLAIITIGSIVFVIRNKKRKEGLK